MAQIFNHTPLQLEVLPLIDARGCIVAVAIAKLSFDIRPDGNLYIAAEPEPLRWIDARLPDGLVRMPSDLAPHKHGADIVIAPPVSEQRRQQLDGARVRIGVGSLTIARKLDQPWPLGALAPESKPRAALAGTYDDAWVRERMPLLPVDFDPAFHQVAPPAQQVAGGLHGDERLDIDGVYPDGTLRCQLPGRAVLVSGNVQSRYFTEIAMLDTLILDAESPRLTLVWRRAIAVRQKFEELSNLSLGLARLRTVRELYGTP